MFTASKSSVKDENVAKIWTLSAQDIDDDEIVRTIDLSHSTVMNITWYPVFLQTCQLQLSSSSNEMKWTHQAMFWCYCEIQSELDTFIVNNVVFYCWKFRQFIFFSTSQIMFPPIMRPIMLLSYKARLVVFCCIWLNGETTTREHQSIINILATIHLVPETYVSTLPGFSGDVLCTRIFLSWR